VGNRHDRHRALVVIKCVERPVFTASRAPHVVKRTFKRLTESVRIIGYRPDQMLIKGDGGGQWKFVQASTCGGAERDRVRLRVAHSPAARRAARSAAMSPEEKTRPA